ncbi:MULTISPECIES: NAD-dependent epimerase/dehydratase family protein [Demequina]|uniref:NAD-dependent epimerase/dehydratase family protein n=1 Tax=Demequina TaxID=577469 RepID=UPI0007824780|nr:MULTISPECIES: NAD-dependent epimerase/dehydratase family protein [Demequina]
MANILILGGTQWLGRTLAELALARGDSVTCLARGESGTVPEGVEFIRSDRRSVIAYRDVQDRDWDAVIEVSWQPAWVEAAAKAIGERATHWTYVSSIAVYAAGMEPGADESAPLRPRLPSGSHADMKVYGEAKVSSERVTRDIVGDKLFAPRPGILAGPGDPTDRVSYWPARFHTAGAEPVLVPDTPDVNVRALDVRDLSHWILDSIVAGTTGPINAVGEDISFEDFIALARSVGGHTGDVVAATSQWLIHQGVQPNSGPRSLPWWLPEEGLGAAKQSSTGRTHLSGQGAIDAGMTRRRLRETLEDCLEDERVRGFDRDREAGLTRGEESFLIERWTTR